MGVLIFLDTMEYEYDAEGIRISSTKNSVTTTYLVDKNRDYAQVLEEKDNAGNLRVEYVHGGDLISQNRNGNMSYYHYDGLGSARALTDDSAAVTDTYTYEAYGTLIDRTGDTQNNYLFTGEQFDANVGFYYLRARYYSPGIGRFVTQDPWGGVSYDPITLHKYLYANADPINGYDPTGLFTWTLKETVVALAVSAVVSYVYGLSYGLIRTGDPYKAHKMGLTSAKMALRWTLPMMTGGSINGWALGVSAKSGLMYLGLSVSAGQSLPSAIQEYCNATKKEDKWAAGLLIFYSLNLRSNRLLCLGRTPGKFSPPGKNVIARMTQEGKIRKPRGGSLQFKASDGKWYDIEYADMAHKTDAVTWWNKTGRHYRPNQKRFEIGC